MKFYTIHFKLRLILIWLSVLVGVPDAIAQQRIACDSITAEMGYTVRSVTIIGKWIPEDLKASVENRIGIGQMYNPVNVSAAAVIVSDKIKELELQYAIRLTGSTSVTYVTAETCDISDALHPKQVAVTIRPYYLRVDLYNNNNNFLPIPKPFVPSYYNSTPPLLLALTPQVSGFSDRKYGTAISFKTAIDFLHLPTTLKNNKSYGNTSLNLNIGATKSLSKKFFNIEAGLELFQPNYTDTSVGWNIGATYMNNSEPLITGVFKSSVLNFIGGIQKNTSFKLIKKLAVGGSARFLENKYTTIHSEHKENSERTMGLYLFTEGQIKNSINRLYVWLESGNPEGMEGQDKYERLSGRVDYATSIGSSHNTIDLNASFGSGLSWGRPPAYHQFYAGNSLANLLYLPFNRSAIRNMPSGPLFRSLGQREGHLSLINGPIGGDAFWHLNMNISFPIFKWSQPLIPDVNISDEPEISLRKALVGQVETAREFIASDLVESRNFPPGDETDAYAARIVEKDIRPVIDYLANKANIFSIKPVLLFDIAQLDAKGVNRTTFIGAGAGMQFSIVNAQVQVGYMHTIAPTTFSKEGNLFLRFALLNLY